MSRCQYNATFLAGYIHSKVEQLQKIVYRLESQHAYSTEELEHFRTDLSEIEIEVQEKAKMITDDQIKPILLEFKELLARAERRRKERVRGLNMLSNQQPPPLTHQIRSNFPQQQKVDLDTLSIYASDNEEEVSLELLSTVNAVPAFKPIKIQRALADGLKDATSCGHVLRDTSNQNQSAAVRQKDRNRNGPSCNVNRHQIHERSRSGNNIKASERSGQRHNRNPSLDPSSDRENGATSRASFASYVSSRQESFKAPVTGLTFPPFRRSLPIYISRKDPSIIGRSEIFVHPPQIAHICPICPGGTHKMYRCPKMLSAGLQERWYNALCAGVCLNCIIRGHSSFTCKSVGACARCETRHNSILCPQNPNNY